MKTQLRFFDLFSGVGGFRKALEKLGHKCIGFSEIDQNAVRTYQSNFNTRGEDYIADIAMASDEEISNLKDFDILCAGFPCQSFSILGNRLGMKDARGTLFYDIARMLELKQPKFFILENVRGLRNHGNGRTLEAIIKILENDLGYVTVHDVLNSSDYGVPQTRRRLFIIGELNGDRKKMKLCFPPSKIRLRRKMQNILEPRVENKYFLSERIKKTVLGTPTKKFIAHNNETDLPIARPLCATMHKMHRAHQDNYVTHRRRLRRLTPRECFVLQGFPRSFADRAQKKLGVSDTQLYRQAGNAVTVNVVYNVAKDFLQV
ncbi:DNA cytosine methyltransferase [Candidatus Omnitrophota bacterium]